MIAFSLIIFIGFIFTYFLIKNMHFCIADYKSVEPFLKDKYKKKKFFTSLLVVFFFLGTITIYLLKGSPFLPSRPFDVLFKKNIHHMNEEEKLVYFEAFFSRYPNDGKAAQQLAVLHLKRGEVIKALNAYSDALRLGEKAASLYVGYGLALTMYNNGTISKDAFKIFEKAAYLEPIDIYPRIFIANFFLQENKEKEAIKYLEEFLKKYSDLKQSDKDKLENYIKKLKDNDIK